MTASFFYAILDTTKGQIERSRLKVIFEMAANSDERRRVRWEGELSLVDTVTQSYMETNRIGK